MANKILSEQDLQWIERNLSDFGEGLNLYGQNIQKLVNTFNDEAIVQTFYASGNFGNQQKEKLTKIVDAIKKYLDVVTVGGDSLVAQTQKFVVRQRELNQYGAITSGAVGASKNVRTVGNNFNTNTASTSGSNLKTRTTFFGNSPSSQRLK